ncbi:MAG: hypothetical protein KAS66_15305 [Candidatus Omnitrophica bacterium]|nr:hypothetical protein [Candidatus Omnitrophota bacterium]
MTLYESCLDYLDLLNLIASECYLTPLESLLEDAIGIREEIAENLDCDVERLTMLTDELDIAVGFEPPTKIYESTRMYAKELEVLLTCTMGTWFLNGKSQRISTSHGTIKVTTS